MNVEGNRSITIDSNDTNHYSDQDSTTTENSYHTLQSKHYCVDSPKIPSSATTTSSSSTRIPLTAAETAKIYHYITTLGGNPPTLSDVDEKNSKLSTPTTLRDQQSKFEFVIGNDSQSSSLPQYSEEMIKENQGPKFNLTNQSLHHQHQNLDLTSSSLPKSIGSSSKQHEQLLSMNSESLQSDERANSNPIAESFRSLPSRVSNEQSIAATMPKLVASNSNSTQPICMFIKSNPTPSMTNSDTQTFDGLSNSHSLPMAFTTIASNNSNRLCLITNPPVTKNTLYPNGPKIPCSRTIRFPANQNAELSRLRNDFPRFFFASKSSTVEPVNRPVVNQLVQAMILPTNFTFNQQSLHYSNDLQTLSHLNPNPNCYPHLNTSHNLHFANSDHVEGVKTFSPNSVGKVDDN